MKVLRSSLISCVILENGGSNDLVVYEVNVDRMPMGDTDEDPILSGSYLWIVSSPTLLVVIMSIEKVRLILFEDGLHSHPGYALSWI